VDRLNQRNPPPETFRHSRLPFDFAWLEPNVLHDSPATNPTAVVLVVLVVLVTDLTHSSFLPTFVQRSLTVFPALLPVDIVPIFLQTWPLLAADTGNAIENTVTNSSATANNLVNFWDIT